MNQAHARMRLLFPSTEQATRAEAALKVDDDDYVSTRRDGAELLIECQAPDAAALRRALDDVLALVGVSEAVIKSAEMDE